jgi:hypothetical protein
MLSGHDVSPLLKQSGGISMTKLVQGRIAHISPSRYSLQPTEHFIAPESLSNWKNRIL